MPIKRSVTQYRLYYGAEYYHIIRLQHSNKYNRISVILRNQTIRDLDVFHLDHCFDSFPLIHPTFALQTTPFLVLSNQIYQRYFLKHAKIFNFQARLYFRSSPIIIIINFYSPVSNTRCHSIGHKMRIARIKIRVDSPGRWERA